LAGAATAPLRETELTQADADELSDCAQEKALQMQAFSEAAEGIRTLDLLHGKQTL